MKQEQGKFPVQINFRSEQKNDKDTEVLEFSAEGIIYKKEKFDYLLFEEVINEIGAVNTIIKIASEEVVILRKGSISMNQRFILNETTTGVYQTPYGPIDMETKTSKISFIFDDRKNKGSFTLVYKMAVQNEQIGTYHIGIDFEGR